MMANLVIRCLESRQFIEDHFYLLPQKLLLLKEESLPSITIVCPHHSNFIFQVTTHANLNTDSQAQQMIIHLILVLLPIIYPLIAVKSSPGLLNCSKDYLYWHRLAYTSLSKVQVQQELATILPTYKQISSKLKSVIAHILYYKNNMTTAHRPTWKPAYGLSDSVNKGYVPTRSYSARVIQPIFRIYLAISILKKGKQGKVLQKNSRKRTLELNC